MSRKFTKIIYLFALFSLTATACQTTKLAEKQTHYCSLPYSTTLTIEANTLCTQIVRSQEEKEKGLSGRNPLTENQSMLFDFTNSLNRQPGFWMKDMKFDLDLIWIKNDKVFAITENVSAPKNEKENMDNNLQLYYPPKEIDAVLEVNAGWSKKNNLKVGDKLHINN